MPPKTGLLGTLSSIALGAGIALGSSAASAQDQQRFVSLCSWIDQQTDPSQLRRIIGELVRNDQTCYFDPATGQSYCKTCLTLAAEKLVTLTATAAGAAT